MCDSCNCTCNTKRTCSCPSITGSWQIDIDTSTEGVLDIFAPENSTVTSDDNSVVIEETLNSEGSINYDLSVTCCDKKVWACSADPLPSTLDNKLFVDSPLTKTVSNCSTNGKITIWIDTNLLKDEKVKVTGSSCSSWYLDDIIEAWDWIRTYVNNCKLVVEADTYKFVKPFAKLMLWADAEILKTHWLIQNTQNQWWFILPMSVDDDNNWDSLADRITTETQTIMGVSTKVIKINKDWYYRVSFKYNVDMNYWVHALRWCVWSSMTWKAIVLDDKDVWEAYWYAISQSATIDARTDIWYAKQASFQNTDVSYFDAGTTFVLCWRLDPYVINWNWAGKNWWIVVKRAWLDTWTIQWWISTENSEAGCVMSVERVSDENWNILY